MDTVIHIVADLALIYGAGMFATLVGCWLVASGSTVYGQIDIPSRQIVRYVLTWPRFLVH